jgi:hypothetical protein
VTRIAALLLSLAALSAAAQPYPRADRVIE